MAVSIQTATTADIVEVDRNNVWHHLTQHGAFDSAGPMVVARGEGCPRSARHNG